MTPKTIVLDVETQAQEELIRRFHAFVMELDQLALAAPDGAVLDQCETAAVLQGQDISRQVLERAVQRRIDHAEKKGAR
jgi:hypothetical protein